MADLEKKDSLLKEAKAKTSMLDDDFSKDFLSSWKSMSATGGDDMDFDFEPVSKGKKKKFDFGMDMDFSLDDAFGKISSFKIDMPDFDFSSSPKEPTKPKEKTDEDSGKGKNQDTNDNFFFSFDFDGGPTAENTTLTKNKIPGDINSKCPVAQDTIDSGRTELSTSEDKGESSTHIVAADKSISFSCSYGSSKHNEKNSDDYPSSCTKELIKSSILGEREKIATAHIDAADAEGNRQNEKKSDDRVSSCTKELIKADSILETSEKIAAARTSLRVRDDTEFEENRNEMNADTVSLPHHGKETKNRLPSLKNEKIITNVKSARDADLSLDDAFGKMSTFKLDLPDVDLPTSPGKHTKPKEKSEEDSGKGNTHGMSSLDFDGEPTPATRNKVMEAMNSKFPIAQATTDNGRPELSVSEGNGEGLTHLDAVDKSCSKYGSSKHNENDLDEDYPSSSTKELSKPDSVLEESEKIAAARIDDVDRSYGGIRHNEKYSDEFTNSCTKELTQPDSVLEEREKIAAAGIDGVDRSSYGDSSHTENKSDDTTSSCIKELIKPDSVLEKSEKIAAAHTPPRDHDGSVYEKQRNEMSVDTALHSIKEAKSGLPSLEHKKMINNVKSSGFKVPSVSPREQGSQLGNQVRFSVICSSYGDSRHTENKSDDTTSSCIKELIKPDLVLEKSEKIAAARTPPRDHDGSVYEKQWNEMSVDTALHSVKEAKSGLPSLEHKKMINDVKSSGFKVPSVSPREQGSQLGNQVQGKFNNKISGTDLIPKLNICHGNKAPSQSIVKKTLSLPSLTVTRGATKDKHPAAPPMQRIAKSPGNVEKSTKLQATIKMVLPVSAEKQTPSTPSLKRKPSEVVDMVPAKPHTPKRVLTGERRMSNIAVREVEEGAQTQGNFVERNRKNDSVDYPSPKFDFSQEASREALQFNMVVENDENVEKAEACAKELDNICNMLKKKHEEAKELLVRALVNNNNLLMLNHPLYEEKIRAVQRLASRLMSRELEVEA